MGTNVEEHMTFSDIVSSSVFLNLYPQAVASQAIKHFVKRQITGSKLYLLDQDAESRDQHRIFTSF
jgi:hypothetical protein